MPGRLFERNIWSLWEAAWEIPAAAENQRIIHLDKATGQPHLRCNTLAASIAVFFFLKLESSWDQTKQDESPWMIFRKLGCSQHICKSSSFISNYHLWTCQMKLRNLPSRKKEKLCEPLLVSDSNYTSIILATLADDLGSVASAYMASHNSIQL